MGLRDSIRGRVREIVGESDKIADEIADVRNWRHTQSGLGHGVAGERNSYDQDDLEKVSDHLVKEAKFLNSLRRHIVDYGDRLDETIDKVKSSERFEEAVRADETHLSELMEQRIEEIAEKEKFEEQCWSIYYDAYKVFVEELRFTAQQAEWEAPHDEEVQSNLKQALQIKESIENDQVVQTEEEEMQGRRSFLRKLAGVTAASFSAGGTSTNFEEAESHLKEDKKEVEKSEKEVQDKASSQNSGRIYSVEADENLRKSVQTAVSNASGRVIDNVKAYNNRDLYSGNAVYIGKIQVENILVSEKRRYTDGQTEVTSFSYEITLSGRKELSTISGGDEKQAIELLFSQILLDLSVLDSFIEVNVEGEDQQLGEIEVRIDGVKEGFALVAFSKREEPSMGDYLTAALSENSTNRITELVDESILWNPG